MSQVYNSAGLKKSAAGAGGASDGVNILAAGTQTANTTGTVLFSNANGITFGMSNSSIVTAQHNAITTGMASNRGSDFVQATAAFAGTSASGTIASNGISVSIGPYITTGRASTDAVGLNTALTAGPLAWTVNSAGISLNAGSAAGTSSGFTGGASISGSFTNNTAGLAISLSHPAWITTGALSNHSHGVSFTSGSVAFQTLSFTNSNGISFNSGTQGIFGSHNAITTGRASTDAIGLNTAQTNVTWSVNSSGLSFNAAGYAGTATAITGRASITLNSAGLSFDGSNLAGVGTGTAVTGRASITLTANSSSVAFSFNGDGLAGTGYTSGTTTGNWTATLSTNGLSQVFPFLTRLIIPADEQLTAITAPTNASMTFRYLEQQCFVTATRVDVLVGMSFSTSAGAGTQTLQQSAYCVIYSKNGASLSSMSSGSTQTTWTMASNTAGQTQLSQAAIRRVSVPVNINMQPGEYFIGFNYITAGTAVSMTHSIYGGNDIQTASNFAEMGSTTNATTGQLWGAMGVYAAASTGMPASVSISSINQTGVNLSAANIAFVLRNA